MCYWFMRRGAGNLSGGLCFTKGLKAKGHQPPLIRPSVFRLQSLLPFHKFASLATGVQRVGRGSLRVSRRPHLSVSSGTVTQPIRRYSFTHGTDIKRGVAGLGSSKWRGQPTGNDKWQSQNKHTGADRGCKGETVWTVSRGEEKKCRVTLLISPTSSWLFHSPLDCFWLSALLERSCKPCSVLKR